MTPVPSHVPGVHLLLDLWGAAHLDDAVAIEEALLAAVAASGAELVTYHIEQFPAGGVTAFAVLSTSHLSLHSWPEYGYCAVDVFTCGPHDPAAVVPVFQRAFETEQVQVTEIARGRQPAGGIHVASTP